MRKFHLLLLSLVTAVALGGSVLFTSCLKQGTSSDDPTISTPGSSDSTGGSTGSSTGGSASDGKDDPIEDPVRKETVVKYVLTDGESETVLSEVKQEEGSVLSYGSITTWYLDKSLQTVVDKAVGDSMTVYGLKAEETAFLDFRSGDVSVDFVEAAISDGKVVLSGAEKKGHTLLYWQVGDQTYRAGDEFVLTEDMADTVITFTAVWQVNRYTISYYSDGKLVESKDQDYGSDTMSAPEKTGYIFLGWYDGDKKVTKIEQEGKLTASWQIRTYSVRFELNGGTGSYKDGTYDYGTVLNLASSTKLGYGFDGWQVSVDGGAYTAAGSSYSIGTVVDAEEITFRAAFTAKQRTITLVGTESGDSVSISTGDNLLASLKGYQGANFSGWFYDEALTRPVGASDVLPAYEDGKAFTLYASFDRSIVIRLISDGKLYKELTLQYGDEISEKAADKYGYTFTGWYDVSGEKVESVPAADAELYAGWQKNKYIVSFETKDEGQKLPDRQEEYLETIVLPELKAGEGNYDVFVGWSDGKKTYPAGTEWSVEKDVTLTAQWEAKMITLKLTDWDGTVLVDESVRAGSVLTLSGDSILNQVDEFEGFYYQDMLGDYIYYEEGDILTDDLTATAYYVNRRTGTRLTFADVSAFVFEERKDGTYYISGREGVFTDNFARNDSDLRNAKLNERFFGSKLPQDLYLPATHNGKLVTAIPNASAARFGAFSIAFYSHYIGDASPYTITGTLYIPSCYDFIGAFAFSSQTATTVEIGRNSQLTGFGYQTGISSTAKNFYGFPDNVTQIANGGFSGMDGHVYDDDGNEITALPTTITYLGKSALQNSTFLKKADLSNVMNYGTGIFYGCTELEEVVLNSIVNKEMFYHCDSLKSIHIPSNVKEIYDYAFSYSGLEEITFATDSRLTSIDFAVFVGTSVSKVELPDSLEKLGDSAFSAKYSPVALSQVKLSASLKTIGKQCFEYTDITDIVLPEGLTSIGDLAFEYCDRLRHVNMPDSLETIGSYAFRKTLSTYTADGTDDFTLDFGSKLTTVGAYAFSGFANVSGISFTKDSELTSIDSYAFTGMTSLKGVIRFPDKLKSIGSYTFGFFRTGSTVQMGENGAAITEVYFPASIESISGYAFAHMNQLTKVVFEDNNSAITKDENGTVYPRLTIGNAAFGWCAALTEIELPCHLQRMTGGVMGTQNGTFINCESLKKVTFRGRTDKNDSELDITSVVFSGCKALKELYIDRNTKITVSFTSSYFGEAGTNTLLLSDCSQVRLYVRDGYYNYYAVENNAWSVKLASKNILRVFATL